MKSREPSSVPQELESTVLLHWEVSVAVLIGRGVRACAILAEMYESSTSLLPTLEGSSYAHSWTSEYAVAA